MRQRAIESKNSGSALYSLNPNIATSVMTSLWSQPIGCRIKNIGVVVVHWRLVRQADYRFVTRINVCRRCMFAIVDT